MECPECEGEMETKLHPFTLYDLEFGAFEADVCQSCRAVFFTNESAKKIEKIAQLLGMWGRERKPIITESVIRSDVLRVGLRTLSKLFAPAQTKVVVYKASLSPTKTTRWTSEESGVFDAHRIKPSSLVEEEVIYA